MAMNRIQFQAGMSMPEFMKDFATEGQCEQVLEATRWPEGFRCPRCNHENHCVLRGGTHRVFQCNACRHQASLIAGTVFQGTKRPLTIWFLAIYLIDGIVSTGSDAPSGCELPHGVVDPSQINASHGGTRKSLCAGWQCARG